ncbi:MAG: AmmeMemoRadiSam system radical SAM enzyme, partial [Bifidobacteriaceae bacterium]|nr:AmmeMemoRadiSam system radical SAM enzyme [Bifidobacteriaceae bacterium]
DGRVRCRLCPRGCRLREGQRGFCFVRQNVGGRLRLTTYGRSSGFQVDPVEKKPLNHFLPGAAVLSFGTAGCNLGCRFCQNWEISTATSMDALMDRASPAQVAEAAARLGCDAVAYTYNDPVIFAEYAIDVAACCREHGIRNIAVSAGYVEPGPGAELFGAMDAANIDLKAFTDGFYRKLTGGRLGVVQDTLRFLVHETDCWTEITTLLIPGLNDSDAEVGALAAWVASELGPDVPVHFTAFHPAARLRDRPPTPVATLRRARRIARDEGLRFVYIGNVPDRAGSTTYCPVCGAPVVERRGYTIVGYALDPAGRCAACGAPVAGVWPAAGPGLDAGLAGRPAPVRL